MYRSGAEKKDTVMIDRSRKLGVRKERSIHLYLTPSLVPSRPSLALWPILLDAGQSDLEKFSVG